LNVTKQWCRIRRIYCTCIVLWLWGIWSQFDWRWNLCWCFDYLWYGSW